MSQLEVETGLLLTRLGVEDAAAVFALVDGDREALGEFLPWVDAATDVAESVTFLETSAQRWADGTGEPYGVFVDDVLVGHLSLMAITKHQAEIGYWLVRAAGGRGVMTRAVERLVRHAFDDLGLERLLIRCRSTNARSAAIPRRLGFTLEGTERHGEVHRRLFYDLDRWSLLAGERRVGSMTSTERTIEVVDNPGRTQFEVRVDGALVGKAVYEVSGERVIFLHTEVDPDQQGKGIAQELAHQALDAVRDSGRRVVAQCPYIASYIRRHPEYADLI